MYRIDTADNVAELPAPEAAGPNPNGYYGRGNAAQGIKGTVVKADHLNAIQEELAYLCEQAGLTLSKTDRTQVYQAMQLLITAANTIPTGTVRATIAVTPESGWLMLDGSTIGKSGSGATHASDSYQSLFVLLWNSMADGQAAVVGGRGGSAAADWAAGKRITLPDGRGRGIIGSGAGAGLTERTHGDKGGAETHQLTANEMPVHKHNVNTRAINTEGTATSDSTRLSKGLAVMSADDDIDAGIQNAGGDQAHNNMQPWLALNLMIKV